MSASTPTSCVSVQCAWSPRCARSTRCSGRRSPLWRAWWGSGHRDGGPGSSAEVDTGQRPGVTTQMAEENKALRKKIAELRWGVEPMCAVLSENGVPISRSTYYEWIAKIPTRRQVRDAELVEIITAAREDKKRGRFDVGVTQVVDLATRSGPRCRPVHGRADHGRERLGGSTLRVQAQDHHRSGHSSAIPGSGGP